MALATLNPSDALSSESPCPVQGVTLHS